MLAYREIVEMIKIEDIELRNAEGELIEVVVREERNYKENITEAYCYPNPSKLDYIEFANLTQEFEIRIYDLAGIIVYEGYHRADDRGKWRWYCPNIASGVYIYVLKDKVSKTQKIGKFALIR